MACDIAHVGLRVPGYNRPTESSVVSLASEHLKNILFAATHFLWHLWFTDEETEAQRR